ncbi:hypothetical protein I3760_02G192900 [Carya illinoinensis]|nr:hypothetical protein I3760_02G192900 [Carya illinoinensis]
MQNDPFCCDEKDDCDFMTPYFEGLDFFECPSEDKFVMTSENKKKQENPLEEKCLFYIDSLNDENVVQVDNDNFDRNNDSEGGIHGKSKGVSSHGCTAAFCKCCMGAGGFNDNEGYLSTKKNDWSDYALKVMSDISSDCETSAQDKIKKTSYSAKQGSSNDLVEGFKSSPDLNMEVYEKDFIPNGIDSYEVGDGGKSNAESHKPAASTEEDFIDELLMYATHEDEYEVFDLRIIHRKNRTGFEENKDLPIVLNTVVAGRYYVSEYLGSAAFSNVVQAHDLHTGMDVCLKIIKNNKDFFDQSLDEIKLLKLVNKHDPADERHILRLYDFFYHREHLIIVCELLRTNLYEFQKFIQESGGEAYFTLSRLQVLFPNDSIVMILARMIGMLGSIDQEMLVQGQETHKYFTEEYDLYCINEETDQLEYIIPESSSLEHRLQVNDIGFIDFVKSLLEINPQRRPTAVEALEHPWLSHIY